MEAHPQTISKIFGNRIRYCVPIFQRHYVWNRVKQWEPLWEDIMGMASARIESREKMYAHYLGALVLENSGKGSVSQVTFYNVIDGQQRLTTIQIILAAIRDIAFNIGEESLATAVDRNILNPDPELMDDSDYEIFKVWPTRFDREIFCDIATLRSRDEIRKNNLEYFPTGMKRLKKIGYIPPILDAYVFYYDKIFDYISLDEAGEISEPDSKRLKILFQSFLDDFRVVEIDLDSGDDAQIIFETMNDRGTPLLASDLIRNYIFSRGEQSKEDVELLYDNEWSYFEDWFWTVKIKQGRYTRPRLEHFVVHFLGAHTGQEVNHGRIFPEYKSYIEKLSKYNNIREEINDLKVFGDIYRNLVEPNTEEVFGRFSERLLVWDVTTIYPLILRIMSDDKVEGFEKIEMFHLLESYIVRRMICRLTPKNYNKLFLQIVRKHRNKTISKKSLLEDLILSTSPSSMWPKDDMFKTSFLTMPMYRVFPPARVKTILLELEHSKRSKLSEEIKILSPLTVEHVMPQNWKANWKSLPSKDRYDVSKWHRAYTNPYPNKANVKYLDEIERREQLIHSIGNLTLLTQALNSTVRDSIYRKKRSHIIKQSSLSLNRYFQKIPEWSESKIQQRANTLFRTAQRIWPFPFEVFDG